METSKWPTYEQVQGNNVTLNEIVGKTIKTTEYCTVEGEEGNELCIAIVFTDNTKHGFVLKS